jgi:hypothetical protein
MQSSLARRTLREYSFNALLALVATIVGYLLVEFIFFRFLFPNFDIGIRPHLPETAEVLAQHSKTGLVPRDYVAILGDSYAEGVGDWLLSNGGNEALPFGPADVLHTLTGRDVVSFGRGGSGSAEGWVRQPARILAGSNCMIFPAIPEPEQIFAFFYAGNDIQDNLRLLRTVRRQYGSDDAAALDRYLSERYAYFPSWQCHLYLWDTIGRMARFAYQYRNFKPSDLMPNGPGANELIIGGKETAAPSPMEGPPVEVDEAGLNAGLMVADRSLVWLRRYFAKRNVTVVYIPSPLEVYRKGGSTITYWIQPPEDNRSATTTPQAIDRLSDRLCGLVRQVAVKYGTRFRDARPALRAAAADNFIHGPVDWGHPNEFGYRALTGFLAGQLDNSDQDGGCQ